MIDEKLEQELREYCDHEDREPGDNTDIDVDDLEYLLQRIEFLEKEADYATSWREKWEREKGTSDHRLLVIGDLTRKLEKAEVAWQLIKELIDCKEEHQSNLPRGYGCTCWECGDYANDEVVPIMRSAIVALRKKEDKLV